MWIIKMVRVENKCKKSLGENDIVSDVCGKFLYKGKWM